MDFGIASVAAINAVLDYQSKNNLAVDSLFLTGRWKYT